MSIAAALAAAADAPRVVIVEGYPVRFRLRPITSADLIEAGGATLLATAMPAESGSAAERVTLSAALSRASTTLAITCASVEAASSDDGQTWEPLRLTLDARRRDPARGILLLSDLPLHVQRELGRASVEHATGGTEASETLARFLGRDAPGSGGAGEAGGALAS